MNEKIRRQVSNLFGKSWGQGWCRVGFDLIYSGCVAKDCRQKSEIYHFTYTYTKNPVEVATLNLDGKPQRMIPGKTNAVRKGLKAIGHFRNRIFF